jgi:hypothetical protein
MSGLLYEMLMPAACVDPSCLAHALMNGVHGHKRANMSRSCKDQAKCYVLLSNVSSGPAPLLSAKQAAA